MPTAHSSSQIISSSRTASTFSYVNFLYPSILPHSRLIHQPRASRGRLRTALLCISPLQLFLSTSPVFNPEFTSGLVGGVGKILKTVAIGGFYSGFGPILFEQVPYTTAEFVVVYETSAAAMISVDPKETLGAGAHTAPNLSAGLIAGSAAAIVSQQAVLPFVPRSTRPLVCDTGGSTGCIEVRRVDGVERTIRYQRNCDESSQR